MFPNHVEFDVNNPNIGSPGASASSVLLSEVDELARLFCEDRLPNSKGEAVYGPQSHEPAVNAGYSGNDPPQGEDEYPFS
jgi:hypothetical protein